MHLWQTITSVVNGVRVIHPAHRTRRGFPCLFTNVNFAKRRRLNPMEDAMLADPKYDPNQKEEPKKEDSEKKKQPEHEDEEEEETQTK
jgi:hypothetical protein